MPKKFSMPNKPRPHRQETIYSCAPACLLMVLEALGASKTEAEIRQDSKCTPLGTDADDLIEAAKKYGFINSVKDYLNFNQLKKQLRQGHYPIVYIGVGLPLQEHSVVVIEINRKEVCILDPIRGEIMIPKRAFEEQWAYKRYVTILIK